MDVAEQEEFETGSAPPDLWKSGDHPEETQDIQAVHSHSRTGMGRELRRMRRMEQGPKRLFPYNKGRAQWSCSIREFFIPSFLVIYTW